jgi:4-carboxymuconolactone decarboxylase
MRLSLPRVFPVEDLDELEDEAKQILQKSERDGRIANIYRTLIRHPKLLKRWSVFGNHVLFKSSLPARDRELLILRVGALCDCGYEFNAHTAIGKGVGLTDEEIQRTKEGSEAEGWNEFDRGLLRAAEELHTETFISDETWKLLSDRYNEEQMIDTVFTVGQYHLVSMALNSFGVQLDEGGMPL